jgi:hypothetical protein
MNNNKYNDKKIEKVFNRCLKLVEKGHSFQYCLEKYSNYRGELEEYFNIIDNLKKFEDIKPGIKNSANMLKNIYNSAANPEEPAGHKIANEASAYRHIRRRSFLKPAIVFATVFVLVIFSFAGTIYASMDSLPGENLYAVKRTAENIQLFFYPESKKGQLHFKFLNNRIDEASTLVERSGVDDEKLIEELLLEVGEEYRRCEKYSFFKAEDGQNTLAIINELNNRYRNKYRQQNQDTEEDGTYDETSYNKSPADSGNTRSENTGDEESINDNGRSRNRKGSEN